MSGCAEKRSCPNQEEPKRLTFRFTSDASMSNRAAFAVSAIPRFVWLWFLSFTCIVLTFPQIDLWTSSLFFTPGVGFDAKGLWWERIIFHSTGLLLAVVTIGLFGTWSYNRLRHKSLLGLDSRKIGMLIGLLILVPGLLVNVGLKAHIGRARPIQVEQFGGEAQFTPAFIPSEEKGCSFSSGHAAAGFWLVVVAFDLSGGFGGWVCVALLYAVVLSVVRIAAGAHFLSDVVASAFFVWMGWLMLLSFIEPNRAETEPLLALTAR